MTAVLMYVGIGMLFVGIFTVFAMIGGLTKETDGLGRSLTVLDALTAAPEEMRTELELPFAERVVAPLTARVQGITRRLTPSDSEHRLREKLDMAGNPVGLTMERINGLKVIGFLAGLVVSVLVSLGMQFGLPVMMFVVLGLSMIGYMAPNLYLHQRAYDRAEQLRVALPDAIDLLTISVESGLAFDASVAQVARNTEGALADEFARMLQEIQIGRSRADALRSLGERTKLPDLKAFVGAMVQADGFGIPMGQVLRVQSSEIRIKRRQWAEEKAQQVPVKILVPLIFCILPCLFLAVLGPAAISIMGSFTGKV